MNGIKTFLFLSLLMLVHNQGWAVTIDLGIGPLNPTGEVLPNEEGYEVWKLDAPFKFQNDEVDVDVPAGTCLKANHVHSTLRYFSFDSDSKNCASHLKINAKIHGNKVGPLFEFYYGMKIYSVRFTTPVDLHIPELNFSLRGVKNFSRGSFTRHGGNVSEVYEKFELTIENVVVVGDQPLKVSGDFFLDRGRSSGKTFISTVNTKSTVVLAGLNGLAVELPPTDIVIFDENEKLLWADENYYGTSPVASDWARHFRRLTGVEEEGDGFFGIYVGKAPNGEECFFSGNLATSSADGTIMSLTAGSAHVSVYAGQTDTILNWELAPGRLSAMIESHSFNYMLGLPQMNQSSFDISIKNGFFETIILKNINSGEGLECSF